MLTPLPGHEIDVDGIVGTCLIRNGWELDMRHKREPLPEGALVIKAYGGRAMFPCGWTPAEVDTYEIMVSGGIDCSSMGEFRVLNDFVIFERRITGYRPAGAGMED